MRGVGSLTGLVDAAPAVLVRAFGRAPVSRSGRREYYPGASRSFEGSAMDSKGRVPNARDSVKSGIGDGEVKDRRRFSG
jgi:hypothetical protein